MRKQLLTTMIGTLMLSTVSFAADIPIKQLPNDMPSPMNDERFSDESDRVMRFNKEKMKEEMQKRQDEFAKRLHLTPEQKIKAESIHKNGMDEMKPIMEEMKKLREKAKEIRQKNKAEFERVLTPEQQKILEQMHQERQAKMKKRFKEKEIGQVRSKGSYKGRVTE